MTPLHAILRVGEAGAAQVVHVTADALVLPMAEQLVDRARRAAGEQLGAPGVYRLQISGQPHAPEVSVVQLAGAADSLVIAELVRGSDGALAIHDLVFSKGQGASVGARQFMDLLGQAIARQAAALDGRARATLEIVIAAGGR